MSHLIRLLYDRSPRVVRETILAIRRRVGRDGFNPMYVPTLISLLHDRRLKQDAREALVAFGEPVIPALVHFMGAEDEPLWVRRALPKTIARIGTPQAAEALVRSLESFEDRFLRRKVIEALGHMGDDAMLKEHEDAIEATVRVELGHYYRALQRLSTIGIEGKGGLSGPEIDWSGGEVEPGLLEKLLGERMSEHLHNIFGLLALLHPGKDIWAAYRSLQSGQAAMRNNALEYLDNTLSASIRQYVSPMLDNRPLSDKIRQANSTLGSKIGSREALLAELLQQAEDLEEESGLSVAAMYHIYAEGVSELYPAIAAVRQSTEDTFVAETADWVAERVA